MILVVMLCFLKNLKIIFKIISAKCPKGGKLIEGKCYVGYGSHNGQWARNFIGASGFCKSMGGKLFEPTTSTINKQAENFVSDYERE